MNLFKKPLRVLILVALATAAFPILVALLLDDRGSPGLLPLYILLSILQPVLLAISVILSILIIYQCISRWRKSSTVFHKLLRVFTITLSVLYLGYVGWVNFTFIAYNANENRYNTRLSKEDASGFIRNCAVSHIYGSGDIYYLGTKYNSYSFVSVGYTPTVNKADIPAFKELAESVKSRCGSVKFSGA